MHVGETPKDKSSNVLQLTDVKRIPHALSILFIFWLPGHSLMSQGA